jgi:uncharacterized membrane protein
MYILASHTFTAMLLAATCGVSYLFCTGAFTVYLYGPFFQFIIMIGIWFLSTVILVLSVYRLIVYHKKVKKYYKVPAVVVGTDIKTVEDAMMGDKYFYAAIVEYTDKEGRQHQMISGEDNPSRPLYQQGAKLSLLVHPDDPTKFLVNDYVGGYIIPVIWIIIGIVIVAIPLMYPETFAE